MPILILAESVFVELVILPVERQLLQDRAPRAIRRLVLPRLAVQAAGLSTLNEGQTVEYEEVANRGKTSAENLKV